MKKAKASAGPKNKRPDGSVSAMIYDSVEKLVANDGMSRAAAFRQIAKQSGRKEGTVAVNYYYAAKKRGAKLRKRGPGKAGAGMRGSAGGGSGRIQVLLKSLGDLLQQQASELESLRRENQRFAAIRQLVGRL